MAIGVDATDLQTFIHAASEIGGKGASDRSEGPPLHPWPGVMGLDMPRCQTGRDLLFVEDGTLFAKRVEQYLAREEGDRFDVRHVVSLEEALRWLENRRFDLVL